MVGWTRSIRTHSALRVSRKSVEEYRSEQYRSKIITEYIKKLNPHTLITIRERDLVVTDYFNSKVSCKNCDEIWSVKMKPGERNPLGWWRCPNGCNDPRVLAKLVNSTNKYLPTPNHSDTWWSYQKLMNIMGDWPYEISKDSWIVCCSFTSEMYAPMSGYPMIHSTSTDCLLWLRWLVLPIVSDYDDYPDKKGVEIELTGDCKRNRGFDRSGPGRFKFQKIAHGYRRSFS